MAGDRRCHSTGDHYNNYKSEPNRILLILDSLIYGEKNIEFLSGIPEQGSVFYPGPAHFTYGANIMAGKLAS